MANPQGFTLLETIVVLAVMALVAAIVVSHGPSRSPRLDVREAAATLAQVMRGARATAIATEAPADVIIDTLGHAIRAGSETKALPAGVALAMTSASGAPLRQRYGDIRFAADGSSSGGSVILAEGTIATQVAVDWLTGRVRLADAR